MCHCLCLISAMITFTDGNRKLMTLKCRNCFREMNLSKWLTTTTTTAILMFIPYQWKHAKVIPAHNLRWTNRTLSLSLFIQNVHTLSVFHPVQQAKRWNKNIYVTPSSGGTKKKKRSEWTSFAGSAHTNHLYPYINTYIKLHIYV